MKEYVSRKEMDRRIECLKRNTVKCDCGHSVTITNKHKRVICTWCGNYAYLDPKDKFKNELGRSIKRVNNE